MAYDIKSLPLDNISYYREQLYRELSNLFEWEGLPEEIPVDYLERTLIRHGEGMFFKEEETFGYMFLKCGSRSNNIYGSPVTAYALSPNQEGMNTHRERTIAYQYTKKEDLDPDNMCILVRNMEGGQNMSEIVDFYALRMAMIIQAFDTNALWQNVPVIFRVGNKTLKLTVEKIFDSVMTGKPFVVVDENLLGNDGSMQTEEIKQDFKLDSLLDVINELKAKFLETIGLNTAGADKKERLLDDEVNANNQAIETALSVMLRQREKACKEITTLYPDIHPTVKLRAEPMEGGEDDGERDDGAQDSDGDQTEPV